MMDCADIDPRALRFEVLQGSEERIACRAQGRDMQEIDAPAGGCDSRIEQQHRAFEAVRLPRRPAAERTEAGVMAKGNLGRNRNLARWRHHPLGLAPARLETLRHLVF